MGTNVSRRQQVNSGVRVPRAGKGMVNEIEQWELANVLTNKKNMC